MTQRKRRAKRTRAPTLNQVETARAQMALDYEQRNIVREDAWLRKYSVPQDGLMVR
jgi:hypothetical protein